MATKRPRRQSTPVDGFLQHGVVLESGASGQMRGDCPFCGREDRFYVNAETGSWHCKKCDRTGGLPQFLEYKTQTNQENLTDKRLALLANNRGVSPDAIKAWRVGWDGEQYTIPVDVCGKMYDLRRYQIGKKVMATTGGKVSLAGITDPNSNVVWLCEGEWDGMAMWDVLKMNNIDGSVYSTVGSSFPSHAIPIFEGKRVIALFDNDKAGRNASKRANSMLSGVAKQLLFLRWPEDVPDKFDVRDLFHRQGKKTLRTIEELLSPTPPGEVLESEAVVEFDGEGLLPDEVIERYRKWLYLPDPEVLSVMFGVAIANRLDGDPIWMFFVAPPGGSKTEILMSLTNAPLIITTTTLTPHALMSGVRNMGNYDPSLIPKLNEKVLVIKDVTTILEMPAPQRDEIFSVLRDAYDGKTEKYFGNGVHRIYHSRFGILGGVTPVIEMHSAASSMLGERFLKYRLPQTGHVKTGASIIKAAISNIAKETKMREELRQIAKEVLEAPLHKQDLPRIPDHMINRIVKLAQWAAAVRGVVTRERYTKVVMVRPTSEVGTRIAKQLTKFGIGVALYHRKNVIDEEVYQIIVSVARSTVPDRVETLLKQLYIRGKNEFAPTKRIAKWSGLPEATVRELLEDLSLLRLVQHDGSSYNKHWRLSQTILQMMRPLGLYRKDEAWRSAKHIVRSARKHKTAKRKKRANKPRKTAKRRKR